MGGGVGRRCRVRRAGLGEIGAEEEEKQEGRAKGKKEAVLPPSSSIPHPHPTSAAGRENERMRSMTPPSPAADSIFSMFSAPIFVHLVPYDRCHATRGRKVMKIVHAVLSHLHTDRQRFARGLVLHSFCIPFPHPLTSSKTVLCNALTFLFAFFLLLPFSFLSLRPRLSVSPLPLACGARRASRGSIHDMSGFPPSKDSRDVTHPPPFAFSSAAKRSHAPRSSSSSLGSSSHAPPHKGVGRRPGLPRLLSELRRYGMDILPRPTNEMVLEVIYGYSCWAR